MNASQHQRRRGDRGKFPDEAQGANIFIRSTSGVISTTTLSFGALYPTVVTGLNASGAIVGYDSSESINDAQGFLWDGQGPLPSPVSSAGVTGIVVPGSTGTFPTGLNADESVVGCYTVNGVYYDLFAFPMASSSPSAIREARRRYPSASTTVT